MGKATNRMMTYDYLTARAEAVINKGFNKQKWVIFCETMMDLGYKVRLYEARQTVSKYVTVIGWDAEYKVRFSNHKPIYAREAQGDCDFFVGVTNLGIATMEMAVKAALKYFEDIDRARGRMTQPRYTDEEMLKNARQRYIENLSGIRTQRKEDSLSQGQHNSRSSREGERFIQPDLLVYGERISESSLSV